MRFPDWTLSWWPEIHMESFQFVRGRWAAHFPNTLHFWYPHKITGAPLEEFRWDENSFIPFGPVSFELIFLGPLFAKSFSSFSVFSTLFPVYHLLVAHVLVWYDHQDRNLLQALSLCMVGVIVCRGMIDVQWRKTYPLKHPFPKLNKSENDDLNWFSKFGISFQTGSFLRFHACCWQVVYIL